jgi:hypothetical protein
MRKKFILTLLIALFVIVNVADAEDFCIDNNYMTLQKKLGEVRAKELWNSPEKLLQAIEGEFSGEYKNIFATRLYDLRILTPEEKKRVEIGLRNTYEDMFFGDSFEVQIIDPNKFEIVDKDMLLDHEENKEKTQEEL